MRTIHEKININHLIDLVDHTDSLLSYVDTEYIYRAANNTYKRKYNKSIDDIVGHYVWEVMGIDVFENIIQPNLQKAFLGETVHYERWFEFPNLPKFYLIVSYNPCFGPNSEVVGVVVNTIDYTKFKVLEEEKKEQDLILQEVAKMAQLGEMISFIAHQWRQPLNTLATYMLKLRQIISINSKAIEPIERCESILDELSLHIESINNLRTANFHHSVNNIKNIFDSVLILIQEHAHILGITIQLDCPDSIRISTQRDILVHVILAILENALDALSISNITDKKIEISVQSNNRHIIITIQDNGDGISSKNSKRIFDEGFTTKESSNRGYGLYFARKLLYEKLGGFIEICSVPKKGACFQIILPM